MEFGCKGWGLSLFLPFVDIDRQSFQESLMSFARRKIADRVLSSLQQGWWQSRRTPPLPPPVRVPSWDKVKLREKNNIPEDDFKD